MLLWFRGLVWTLEDAVYDMTMDDFDFQVPSIEFEYIKQNESNRRGQFIYAKTK